MGSPLGATFEADRWELYHLDEDFNETNDLATAEPDRLAKLIETWWQLAERHNVLPLDDRFGPRFAENAARFHGPRTRYVMHAGMGHVPTEVAPDLRSRGYLIEAFVELSDGDRGVLIAHGDATSGYSLYIEGGHLVHDWNVGGKHVIVRSGVAMPAAGAHRLGVHVRRLSSVEKPTLATGPGTSEIALVIDGTPVGRIETKLGFPGSISWSGLDIGRDRGSPVSHYEAPFAFTGRLLRVEVTMDNDQRLDGDAVGRAVLARE